ncbi:PD-(D/E)XK nuclease family protein [bacterium]|nr:PD-(D/E)XK nuclease family protein [bacterium]
MSSGLQTWEDKLGLEADLFMRILHGGKKVIITWPAEKAGRPTLPSPFISRLTTTLKNDIEFADGAPVYREQLPDLEAIRNEQAKFQNEGFEIPVTGSPRKASHLSNSSISKYLGCPFHYLIEKGFGIGQEDEMDSKIGGKEYGEITHSVMNSAFTYSELPKLLADGDIAGAEAALREVADKEFSKRGDLSQSRMWEASFLQFVPEIIKLEIENLDLHMPSKHEAPFEFKLGELQDLGITVPSEIEKIFIKGRIDRIDINLKNEKSYHVYDYKSGQIPKLKNITAYKDLQLHIYAMAMTLGKVSGVSGSVISGGYYKLGKDEVRIKPEVEFTPDILKEAAETIVDVAVKSRNYDESFRLLNEDDWGKSGDPGPCRYCHLKTTCRIDEVR